MFLRRFGLLAGAAFVSTGCTVGTTGPAGTEPVTPDYFSSGGAFDSGGTLISAIRVRNDGGFVSVCGARTTTRLSGSASDFEFRVTRAGIVQFDGKNLLQGLQIFPEYKLKDNLTGLSASCFSTGLAWEARFEDLRPEVSFVRLQFGDSEDGVIDTFRETAVPDVARAI